MKARHGRNRLSREMLECARLAATGEYTQVMIAEYLGCSETTVRKWLQDERVLEVFRNIIQSNTAVTVAKARRVIDKSLDSDAANGYLALNAAQTALARYDDDVMNKEDKEIRIVISGGMPEIGMPQRPDDE